MKEMEFEKERKLSDEKVRGLEENLRFLEEMMKDSPGQEMEQRMKQYERQLQISENKAREALRQVVENKKLMAMKQQQELELGKVIQHLETALNEEKQLHNQTKVAMQNQSGTNEALVWKDRFYAEQNKLAEMQGRLGETEQIIEQRTTQAVADASERVRVLEEKVVQIKGKAREKLAEKDAQMQEQEKKYQQATEMIGMLETTCKEAVMRQEEALKRATEQEDTLASHNKIRYVP